MKVPLLGLTAYILDTIGVFIIVQIILQLGQLTHLFSSKALLGKDIDGKESILDKSHREQMHTSPIFRYVLML